jgi:hypothetical protein
MLFQGRRRAPPDNVLKTKTKINKTMKLMKNKNITWATCQRRITGISTG